MSVKAPTLDLICRLEVELMLSDKLDDFAVDPYF